MRGKAVTAARKSSGRASVQDSRPTTMFVTPGSRQRRRAGELDGCLVVADQLVDRGRHGIEEGGRIDAHPETEQQERQEHRDLAAVHVEDALQGRLWWLSQ